MGDRTRLNALLPIAITLSALTPGLGWAEAEDETTEEATQPVRNVAELTQGVAQGIGHELQQLMGLLASVDAGDLAGQTVRLALELSDLGFILLLTVGVLLVLRPAARPIFDRAEAWAQRGDARFRAVRRTVGVLGAALADLATIVLAWLSGYGVALLVLGDVGSMEPRQSLYLNAFVLMEGLKALLRILFATRNEHLRLVPTETEHAAYWQKRLARMASLIGYGLLFLAPLTTMAVSPLLGQAVLTLIMATAFLYAIFLALRNRDDVRERLSQAAGGSKAPMARVILSGLAWMWHWLVILYFGAFASVTILEPQTALTYIMQATLQTALAVGIGTFLALAATQATSRRIQLSEPKRRHFPLLEQRLNAYIPTTLKIGRAGIVLAVAAVVLDAWNIIALPAWLRSESGLEAIGVLLSVTLILIAALAAWLAAASLIEHRLHPEAGQRTPTAREQTLLTLFRNAIAVTLVALTAMLLLAEIGINIGPLIAGAGVLGLAIGFGAQKLVQDIITGVFIQLENAIDVGDIITASGITGTVEKLTIRSVNIRDLAGTYHFIPFSSVDSISNFTRHYAYHVGYYRIAYHEDIDRAMSELEAGLEDLKAHPDREIRAAIYHDLAVDGVAALGESSIDIRARIQTAPGMQWAVGRAYNEIVKKRLDAAGIEIPFPNRTLHLASGYGSGVDRAATPHVGPSQQGGAASTQPAGEDP